MNIIRDKITTEVIYYNAELYPDKIYVKDSNIIDTVTDRTNLESIEVSYIPSYFESRAFLYDTTTQAYTLSQYGNDTLLPKLKDEKKEILRQNRKEKETAGVLYNGVIIETDSESQSKLLSVIIILSQNSTLTINWKCRDGWIVLSSTNIGEVSNLIYNYVQTCFNTEKDKIALINAATTIDELDAIDLTV